ncbi:hypothetical protein LGH83_05180 [Lichenihabitans sp. PAMC28606]|uniref:hypothetical protein n=1 Tax=Lichenihabitans sp. PAMC28606 TaxID=2880932 RepID=UPI001D0BB1A9|nr:hypothetical protein [Lichenihabitans sp. PAMC28606]UDL95614.1 hypothetical protein LGH83_05180 [Lichenihabitans sp. PAMC28606]
MKRSATTEAFRGGADSKAVSQKFGNSIDRSAFLFKTYNPVDLEQVRQARSGAGERKPAEQIVKSIPNAAAIESEWASDYMV